MKRYKSKRTTKRARKEQRTAERKAARYRFENERRPWAMMSIADVGEDYWTGVKTEVVYGYLSVSSGTV